MFSSQIYCVTFVNHRCTGGFTYFTLHFIHATFCIEPRTTVAGVAALVKSYFPKLTGSQIRDILLKSVTSRKGVEVEKGIRVNDSPSQDLFLFDDLCISGGIVNAYQAILEAEKVSK